VLDVKLFSEKYKAGKNIIEAVNQQLNSTINATESILISYDLQAGSYVDYYQANRSRIDQFTRGMYDVLSSLEFSSMLDVGTGEATTLFSLLSQHNDFFSKKSIFAFDISLSRVMCAKKFLGAHYSPDNVKLFTADMFSIPLPDNSIDLIFSSHALEPNGGREAKIIQELLRVSSKYLVLFEPAYELASDEAKKRMEHFGYIRNLPEVIKKAGAKLLRFDLLKDPINSLNPTGVFVVEKAGESAKTSILQFTCPKTKQYLSMYDSYCYAKSDFYIYPIIHGVPNLIPDNAILATKVDAFAQV
jgi:ubiquinone/menaquinone biosynthesis C-methylase UbiE/uncharacterized protein YbaR (Trm112 family)